MTLSMVMNRLLDDVDATVRDRNWSALSKNTDALSRRIAHFAITRDRQKIEAVDRRLSRVQRRLRAAKSTDADAAERAAYVSALVTLLRHAADELEAMEARRAPLGDNARAILHCLAEQNRGVNNVAIAEATGIATETVSRQLGALADKGFVTRRRRGKATENAITEAGRQALG